MRRMLRRVSPIVAALFGGCIALYASFSAVLVQQPRGRVAELVQRDHVSISDRIHLDSHKMANSGSKSPAPGVREGEKEREGGTERGREGDAYSRQPPARQKDARRLDEQTLRLDAQPALGEDDDYTRPHIPPPILPPIPTPKKGWSKTDKLVQNWRGKAKLFRGHPPILPQPRQWQNGTSTIFVASSLHFIFPQSSPPTTDVLDKALVRYKRNTFRHQGDVPQEGTCVLTSIEVEVADLEFRLDSDTDESYELVIPGSDKEQQRCPPSGLVARIKAQTQIGALRGLETFSQLVTLDLDRVEYSIKSAPWLVKDAPRFAYRAVMLDTGRHFLPVPSLKRAISSMAMAKFNVFHWHLIDHQSFPLVSKAFPSLSSKGAFSPMERYAVHDVREVVEWARMHGIRVIPELDVPGHASSWCSGYPDICPSPQCLTPLSPIRPTSATPTESNLTFEVIDALLTELSQSFHDAWVHVGGDEVEVHCWDRVPRVKRWMRSNGFAGAKEALNDFQNQILSLALRHGKRPVVWQEAFVNAPDMDSRAIVHRWVGRVTLTKDAIRAGHDVIISDVNRWYLNDRRIYWEQAWRKDPCAELTAKECKSIIGGMGAIWGERVDPSNLEPRMWPRLAGIAEALWTGRGKRAEGLGSKPSSGKPPAVMYEELSQEEKLLEDADRERFRMRLHGFRCLLLARGVAAEPTNTSAPVTQIIGQMGPPLPGGCFYQ